MAVGLNGGFRGLMFLEDAGRGGEEDAGRAHRHARRGAELGALERQGIDQLRPHARATGCGLASALCNSIGKGLLRSLAKGGRR